jgi:hypothetical protein
MLIHNVHEREIRCPIEQASLLIDTFSEPEAILWPSKLWPREPFNGPLQVGAIGSHGGTIYRVEAYQPGRQIRFRFISPKGYQGTHEYELQPTPDRESVIIKHVTKLELSGMNLLAWKLAICWVHDALIEDGFSEAEKHLTGQVGTPSAWLWRVYLLRHWLGGSRLIYAGFKKLIRRKKCDDGQSF